MPKCLEPINIVPPPSHTQVRVPCATCTKFPVCNLREDMLKTVYLVQQVLGDPQEDRLATECDCHFGGYDFEDITIFPETITGKDSKDKEVEGKLLKAKYRDKDTIQILYNINNYHVMFQLDWDKEEEKYIVSSGKELYYNLLYTASEESVTALQAAPTEWREEMIKKEEDTEDVEVINTTYFSANLNCDFYEYQKGLTEEEGWRRIELQYAKTPVESDKIQHLLTYHIEPKRVPYEDLRHSNSPMPILYPVYIPKMPKPPKGYPQRRDDLI